MNYLWKGMILGLLVSSIAEAGCQNWSKKTLGTLDKNILDEASGLTVSRLRPDHLLWINDSGGKSEIYATSRDGEIVHSARLKGFANLDIEALESGPCPLNPQKNCIYVGDIGNGIGWRPGIKIGIFSEEEFWATKSLSPQKIIKTSFPGGSDNAEAMVVYSDGTIIIFSKDTSGVSKIFKVMEGEKVTQIGELDLNQMVRGHLGRAPLITDASLSPDGTKVLLLTYSDIIEMSAEGRSGHTVITGPKFPQQETITYIDGGKSFIVSTESVRGSDPIVMQYSCLKNK